MNAKELGSQPAYPTDADNRLLLFAGVSKRELFAAMAMQGLLSSGRIGDFHSMFEHHEDDPTDDRSVEQAIAEDAADYADALLAELAKDQ